MPPRKQHAVQESVIHLKPNVGVPRTRLKQAAFVKSKAVQSSNDAHGQVRVLTVGVPTITRKFAIVRPPLIVSCLIIWILFATNVGWANTELESEMRTKGIAGWNSHAELAMRCSGNVIQKSGVIRFGDSNTQEIMRTRRGSFEISGHLLRRVSFQINDLPTTFVSCRNADYQFRLSRANTHANYALSDLDTQKISEASDPSEGPDGSFSTLCADVLFGAFTLGEGFELQRLILSPKFRLLSIGLAAENPNHVRLEFQLNETTPRPVIWKHVEVICDRENGWSVTKSVIRFPDDYIREQTVEYLRNDGKNKEVAMPVKSRFVGRWLDPEVVEGDEVVTEIAYKKNDVVVASTDFTLSAFGLPEPTLGEPPSRWRGWLLPIIIIQIGLLLMYVGRRWYRSVQERS